jgi:hypothetical protein
MKTNLSIELARLEWVAGEEVTGHVVISFVASRATEAEQSDVILGVVITSQGIEAVQWVGDKSATLSNSKQIFLRQSTIDVQLPVIAGM